MMTLAAEGELPPFHGLKYRLSMSYSPDSPQPVPAPDARLLRAIAFLTSHSGYLISISDLGSKQFLIFPSFRYSLPAQCMMFPAPRHSRPTFRSHPQLLFPLAPSQLSLGPVSSIFKTHNELTYSPHCDSYHLSSEHLRQAQTAATAS